MLYSGLMILEDKTVRIYTSDPTSASSSSVMITGTRERGKNGLSGVYSYTYMLLLQREI